MVNKLLLLYVNIKKIISNEFFFRNSNISFGTFSYDFDLNYFFQYQANQTH